MPRAQRTRSLRTQHRVKPGAEVCQRDLPSVVGVVLVDKLAVHFIAKLEALSAQRLHEFSCRDGATFVRVKLPERCIHAGHAPQRHFGEGPFDCPRPLPPIVGKPRASDDTRSQRTSDVAGRLVRERAPSTTILPAPRG